MKTKLLLFAFLFCTVLMSHGQWTYTHLSEPKSDMGYVSLGNKAWFAGGANANGSISAAESYNVTTGQWESFGDLSVARMNSGAAACGSKIFICGGAIWMSSVSSQVDIYDTLTQQWSTAQLAEARYLPSVVSYGNKVLVAGGLTDFYMNSSAVVDIYDCETGSWSTGNLSIHRGCMASAVVGDIAIFAGGFVTQDDISDQVDIYHFSTGTWSTTTLSEPRAFCEATAVGNKVLIAGGIKAIDVPSNVVDIYDASSDSWSTATLSAPRALARAATVNGKAYFAGGGIFNFGWHDYSDVIDIYDSSGTWSVDHMSLPRIGHAVLGVMDHLIIAGGDTGSGLTDLVEIFYDPSIAINEHMSDNFFSVYPNPSSGHIHIKMGVDNHKSFLANVYNMQGQVVFTKDIKEDDRDLSLQLPSGVYLLRIIAEDKICSELITVK
jgi:hypothetical protein